MRKPLIQTVTILLALTITSFAADMSTAEIEAREKAAWQAYKDKKSEEFGKMLSSDYRGIYAEGVLDKAGEVSGMQKTTMNSFTLSDFKTVSPDANTTVVTYAVSADAVSEGEKFPEKMYVSSVWHKVGGEWRVLVHTSVAAKETSKQTP